MNSRAFSLSLIIAAIAMFMVYSYIEGREAEFVQKFGKQSAVVVAGQDIKELELIDDSKVTIVNVPQNFLSPGHFKDIKEIYNTIAAVPILKGEQITKPRVTYPGARTGLSRQVSLGKRAVSIQVSEDQAVSKLIKPGDRVDILAMMDYAGGKKEFSKVKTILQDVLVLSTGYNVTNAIPLVGVKSDNEIKTLNLNTYNNFNTITLELDPFQAQKLIFITMANTKPFLTLRNNDDKQIVRINGTRLFDLLGEDAAEAKAYFSAQQAKDNASRGGR